MNYPTANSTYTAIHEAIGPHLEFLMIIDYPPAVYTIVATQTGGETTHITDPDEADAFIQRIRRTRPPE